MAIDFRMGLDSDPSFVRYWIRIRSIWNVTPIPVNMEPHSGSGQYGTSLQIRSIWNLTPDPVNMEPHSGSGQYGTSLRIRPIWNLTPDPANMEYIFFILFKEL